MNRFYENSGALFRNDRRRGDKDPEFRGQCVIDGKDFWMAAWTNKTREGRSYLKIKFTEQEARPSRSAPTPPPLQQRGSPYPVSPRREREPGSDDEEIL